MDVHSTVYQHLCAVKQDPSKPLDEILLRKIDETTAERLSGETLTLLLSAIQELLPTLHQDATPVTSLVMRLIQPQSVKFEQVDALLTQNGLSNHQYLIGLESQDKDVNLLTINLLNKAANSPSGIGLVAGKADVVRAWIKLWLTTAITSVGQRAGEVLEDFLMAGIQMGQATTEENLMARRVFRDRDVYESMFSLCSFQTLNTPGQPDKRQKTIAQARLLEFLVRIDHPSSPVRDSQFPDIETHYGVMGGKHGLLYFAFIKMVDSKEDDLMLSTLIGICKAYLMKPCPVNGARSSYALSFLKENGLHNTCMSYFLSPASDHGSWLFTDAAEYLITYSTVWRDEILQDHTVCHKIAENLSHRFKHASKVEWHSSESLSVCLAVLRALPKVLHIPGAMEYADGITPLFSVPADSSSELVISVLADIFCKIQDYGGMVKDAMKAVRQADQMTARILYFTYIKRNPDLWSHLVKTADTIALTPSALAAIKFMDSFVNADWALVAKEMMPLLPSESELAHTRGGVAAPTSGIETMVFERGVAEIVLPYVLAPAKSFSSSTQGRAAFHNGEDPAKSVANAKFELTAHMLERLEVMQRTPELQQILDVFTKRVAENSRATVFTGMGESVATMRR